MRSQKPETPLLGSVQSEPSAHCCDGAGKIYTAKYARSRRETEKLQVRKWLQGEASRHSHEQVWHRNIARGNERSFSRSKL